MLIGILLRTLDESVDNAPYFIMAKSLPSASASALVAPLSKSDNAMTDIPRTSGIISNGARLSVFITTVGFCFFIDLKTSTVTRRAAQNAAATKYISTPKYGRIAIQRVQSAR